MKTTIDLDDELVKEAELVAARTGRTLGAVVEDALRQSLPRSKPEAASPISLPTVGGKGPRFTTSGEGGLLPGVDVDNSAALLEIMEN